MCWHSLVDSQAPHLCCLELCFSAHRRHLMSLCPKPRHLEHCEVLGVRSIFSALRRRPAIDIPCRTTVLASFSVLKATTTVPFAIDRTDRVSILRNIFKLASGLIS